jgi:hypothetical protein
MKIDPEEYLTPGEAAIYLGYSRRALYRTTKRAEDAGHVVRTQMFGKHLYLKKAVEVLKQYHYDMHDRSPEAVARRQEWGRNAMKSRWG